MKHVLLVGGLLVLLAACDAVAPKPGVSSVIPANNATDVELEATVQARVDLQNGDLDLVTLSDTSVVLSGPAGPVAAERNFDGTTLTLEPNEDLAPNTTYTFSVTSDLQLASGAGFTPFSSTFTTGISGGTAPLSLEMRNAMGLPSETRMVLITVDATSGDPCYEQPAGCDPNRWQNIAFYDTGTLELQNTGDSPLTVTLTSDPGTLFSLSASTITIDAGATEEVTVSFLGTGLEEKGLYPATITAASGTQTMSFPLVGVFQPRPEGSAELPIGILLEAFGYQTDLGATSGGSIPEDEVDSPKAGTEVRSHYWRAANSGADIVVSQLAAFLPCCGSSQETFDFELFSQAGAEIARLPFDTNYSQSIFPAAPDGDVPNTLSLRSGAAFRFDIFGYSSVPGSGFLGVRFWPLVDEAGESVANTYIVAQDFVRGPCGSGGSTTDDGPALGSNCDYNDGLYLVENIEPVDPY